MLTIDAGLFFGGMLGCAVACWFICVIACVVLLMFRRRKLCDGMRNVDIFACLPAGGLCLMMLHLSHVLFVQSGQAQPCAFECN